MRPCPHCKRGRRIDASYDLGGVEHADGYCSWCGKQWPLAMTEEERETRERRGESPDAHRARTDA